MDKLKDRRIAVVGLGPRGVGALEALAGLADKNGICVPVDLFDPHPAPGAGPNFDPAESDLCRLNIPMRDIDLRAPEAMGLAPLSEWLVPPIDRDSFPPRPRLGAYLQHRLDALMRAPGLTLTNHAVQVENVSRRGQAWHLKAGGVWRGP